MQHGEKLEGCVVLTWKCYGNFVHWGGFKVTEKVRSWEGVHPGPLLESKGICAIFQKKCQKKGKQGQNNWKFGQKCKRFENILKKGQPHACDYRMHETAKICPDIPTLYAQRIKGIIVKFRKTVYINVYLHVNQTLLKAKTEKKYN